MSTYENNVPRDARVISLILRSLGIEECEPRVIIQILEFCYKYTTDVLTDAQLYADYSERKIVTAQDVKLALQTKIGKYFVSPPPRVFMSEIAACVNARPLTEYESENFVRVPNSKKALLGLDYEIMPKEIDKKRKHH